MGRGVSRDIEVVIGGQRYTLRSDEPEDHVKHVAGVVDDALLEVTGGKRVATFHVAVLAAMNIASELAQLRREHEELKADVDARTRSLIEMIDGRLTSAGRL
jgi:cell division protein ZapA (FtsZ GTPase activity inhibitor)